MLRNQLHRATSIKPLFGYQIRLKGSSTPAWLDRQRRDPFVRDRGNYRSRSAFKLLQLNEKYRLFPKLKDGLVNDKASDHSERRKFTVVDLGCTPGGWSQVSLELLGVLDPKKKDLDIDEEEIDFDELDDIQHNSKPHVIGVDLLHADPLLGARFITGDFLDTSVQTKIQDLFGASGKADLILSDISPNIRGNRIADIEACLEICRSILIFAGQHLHHANGKDSKS